MKMKCICGRPRLEMTHLSVVFWVAGDCIKSVSTMHIFIAIHAPRHSVWWMKKKSVDQITSFSFRKRSLLYRFDFANCPRYFFAAVGSFICFSFHLTRPLFSASFVLKTSHFFREKWDVINLILCANSIADLSSHLMVLTLKHLSGAEWPYITLFTAQNVGTDQMNSGMELNEETLRGKWDGWDVRQSMRNITV